MKFKRNNNLYVSSTSLFSRVGVNVYSNKHGFVCKSDKTKHSLRVSTSNKILNN